jgi:protein SCO1/2
MDKRRFLHCVGASALARGVGFTLLGSGLAACSESTPKQSFRADFKGKVVVMFFGYAQCPDVCPTTMTEMAQVRQQLGKDADKLQVVFVTVDPERDTAPVMKAYTQAFDPSIVALIPTPEELAALSKDFKFYYKKVEGSTPTSYSMDHSAASYVYDPAGRLRLYSRYGSGVEPMVADVKTLLAQG